MNVFPGHNTSEAIELPHHDDIEAPRWASTQEPIELRPSILCAGDPDVDVLGQHGPTARDSNAARSRVCISGPARCSQLKLGRTAQRERERAEDFSCGRIEPAMSASNQVDLVRGAVQVTLPGAPLPSMPFSSAFGLAEYRHQTKGAP